MSAFGLGGLISAMAHPHAGPTGAPILGLASTPPHSALLLGLGIAGIAAASKRRAAVTVTALSAAAYLILLFFSSVATARAKPTLFGFDAADIVLHGVLAVANLALLMWLIPDELSDEAWVRRRRGGDREHQRAKDSAAATKPAVTPTSVASAATPQSSLAATELPPEPNTHRSSPPPPIAPELPMRAGKNTPPVSVRPARSASAEQRSSQQKGGLSARNGDSPAQPNPATRVTDAVTAYGAVMAALTVVAAVGIRIWKRRK